ncbi:MAG: hypothetical protein ACLP3C_29660 [Mycobacterium sp.]|uniref:hypothetical protein n=1 Tax=Mycobacterium sp. TaxID=1785 RepID=UPI003F99FAB1
MMVDKPDNIESDAYATIVGRAHQLNPTIPPADLCATADRLETWHVLAGLTPHDTNLCAELIAWALARILPDTAPRAYLKTAAGSARWDDPAAATAALHTAATRL